MFLALGSRAAAAGRSLLRSCISSASPYSRCCQDVREVRRRGSGGARSQGETLRTSRWLRAGPGSPGSSKLGPFRNDRGVPRLFRKGSCGGGEERSARLASFPAASLLPGPILLPAPFSLPHPPCAPRALPFLFHWKRAAPGWRLGSRKAPGTLRRCVGFGPSNNPPPPRGAPSSRWPLTPSALGCLFIFAKGPLPLETGGGKGRRHGSVRRNRSSFEKAPTGNNGEGGFILQKPALSCAQRSKGALLGKEEADPPTWVLWRAEEAKPLRMY